MCEPARAPRNSIINLIINHRAATNRVSNALLNYSGRGRTTVKRLWGWRAFLDLLREIVGARPDRVAEYQTSPPYGYRLDCTRKELRDQIFGAPKDRGRAQIRGSRHSRTEKFHGAGGIREIEVSPSETMERCGIIATFQFPSYTFS